MLPGNQLTNLYSFSVSYSLKSLKGVYIRDYIGDCYRGLLIKGDTSNLDYASGGLSDNS